MADLPVDDFCGGRPAVDGRTFVGDTGQLESLLWTLAAEPTLAR